MDAIVSCLEGGKRLPVSRSLAYVLLLTVWYRLTERNCSGTKDQEHETDRCIISMYYISSLFQQSFCKYGPELTPHSPFILSCFLK